MKFLLSTLASLMLATAAFAVPSNATVPAPDHVSDTCEINRASVLADAQLAEMPVLIIEGADAIALMDTLFKLMPPPEQYVGEIAALGPNLSVVIQDPDKVTFPFIKGLIFDEHTCYADKMFTLPRGIVLQALGVPA